LACYFYFCLTFLRSIIITDFVWQVFKHNHFNKVYALSDSMSFDFHSVFQDLFIQTKITINWCDNDNKCEFGIHDTEPYAHTKFRCRSNYSLS
jgi:hypothetical protein